MWNIPTKERLDIIPRLYETESVQLRDKIVHLHFFIGGSDWYVCEYDGKDVFFGFAILNGDLINAEWGYVALTELININHLGVEVDFDLHWKIRRACEVENIRQAQGW